MSSQDVFITDEESSPLRVGLEGQLHHPFQSKRMRPNQGRQEIRVIDFVDAGFNRRNTVQVENIPMTVHDMYLQLKVSAGVNSGDPAENPYWVPSPSWISDGNLNYKETSIYHFTEAQIVADTLMNLDSDNNFNKQKLFSIDALSATTAQIVYIPLTSVAENILSKTGPLASYASNDFSVDITLRAVNNLLSTLATSTETTAQTATLNSMSLVLVGTLSDEYEIELARNALMTSGIQWSFLRPVHFRSEIADNGGSASQAQTYYDSVVGAVNNIRILLRNKTAWDSTTASTVDPWDFRELYNPDDTISVGTVSDPNQVGGIPIPFPVMYALMGLNSNKGNSRLLEGQSVIAGISTAVVGTLDSGMFNINFNESHLSNDYGLSTGSWGVKNNAVITLNFASDTVSPLYWDTIFYTHVKGFITVGSANINLSS